jgi:hypothetical protein
MKNLILILFLAVFSLSAVAQEKYIPLDFNKTYLSTTNFTLKDTIATGQTPYNLQVYADKQVPCTQYVQVKLDSISGPKVTLQLKGSVFGDTWANIGSAVTWSGSTADTTINISNATANRYRLYDLVMTRVAGKAKVSAFKIKVLYE